MTDENIIDFINRYLSADASSRDALAAEILIAPFDQFIPSRIVILLRQQGRLDDAELIASHFINVSPFDRHVNWELGYGFGVSGRPHKSIAYVKNAIRLLDSPERRLWLGVQEAMTGNFTEAERILRSIKGENTHIQSEIKIHNEFFRFLKEFNREKAFDLLDSVKTCFTTKSIADLESDIFSALNNKTPYLLLRLGDGEGAHIRLDKSDEQSYAHYYRANRDEFTNIWFRSVSVHDEQKFSEAVDLFNESIVMADAIGGSMYTEAIDVEYDYSSRRGIAWVINTMRKLLVLARDRPKWAQHTPIYHLVVHYDLLLSGALARLLHERQYVGLISCQDDLPNALKNTYNIETLDFIKVPGEQIHSETLGTKATHGKHWPDRYHEIISLLDKPSSRSGQLWLVAAGMLGKIYAAKLKAAGAVVIDIGAVADLWMGKMTRTFPDLPKEIKLQQQFDILTLVDVGGLGGLGEEWLPHIDRVRAILFEPNPPEAAFARQKIAASPGGVVIERALSNRPERRTLHVTKSLGCTSLFTPNEDFLSHYSIAPAFQITNEFEVECVRFDSLVSTGEAPLPDVIKIDVQGFEYNILEGFGGALQHCLAVKTEAHLYQIYHGQKLLHDIVDLMYRSGLTLRRLQPVKHFDGDIVEVDAWFTCSADRINTLTAIQKRKLSFIEKVWQLEERVESFGTNQFD